ncbi:MAG: endonuclease, partial [Acidobacteriota bacterium]|nr:endonuclease [Acidobacteriota bacterium]
MAIQSTASKGMEWGIELAGKGQYRFKLGKLVRIVPRPDLIAIKIPDATPEIITPYALTHEQSLLAKVRDNRLIDVFMGIASYSLQNYLQTFVKNMGRSKLTRFTSACRPDPQEIACRVQKFPRLTCRPISAQFMSGDTIALFELALQDDDVKIVEERH